MVETELLLADLESVGRALERAQKQGKSGDKDALVRSECFAWLEEKLDTGSTARSLALAESWQPLVRQLNLLTAKQVLFVANIGESDLAGNAPDGDGRRNGDGGRCGKRRHLRGAGGGDRGAGCGRPRRVPRRCRYRGAGPRPLHSRRLSPTRLTQLFSPLAPKSAERGPCPRVPMRGERRASCIPTSNVVFIRAEVIDCDDFIDCNGETGARDAGRMRVEGKDYLVRDGDVIRFRFNV